MSSVRRHAGRVALRQTASYSASPWASQPHFQIPSYNEREGCRALPPSRPQGPFTDAQDPLDPNDIPALVPRLRRTLVLGVLAVGLWIGLGMPGFPGSPPVLAVSARPPRSVSTPACLAQGPSPSLACDKTILLALRDDLLAGSHTGYNMGFLRYRDVVPLRDFWGVTVGGEPPRVTRLEMSPSVEGLGCQPCTYLGGIVPPALGRLAQLEHLALTANRLTGPIPGELGQLDSLRVLDLDDNPWTGCWPPAIRFLVPRGHFKCSSCPDLPPCQHSLPD